MQEIRASLNSTSVLDDRLRDTLLSPEQSEISRGVREIVKPSPQLPKMRVLLVGFADGERQAAEECLVGWGASSSAARSGSEAVAAVNEQSRAGLTFQATLVCQDTDPRQALAVARRLREQVQTKNVPLIACLRSHDPTVKKRLLAAGFDSVLPLPVDKRLLFNALHTATAPLAPKQGVISLGDYYARRELAKRTSRILVAGKNHTSRKVISKILDRAGHQVTTVDNGEMALDELERSAYDIVLLEMAMPKMGGLDVVKALRFLRPGNDQIPAIVFSADATANAQRECEEAGVDAFLPEPIEAAYLLHTVTRLASKQGRERIKDPAEAAIPERGDKQLVNMAVLAELETYSADPAFVPELIDGFVRDGKALFVQMETALQASRFQEFRDLLYSMKGSAASLGAAQLVTLCAEIETMDQKKLRQDSAKTLNRIASTIASTCTALSEYLRTRQSAVI